MFDRFTERARKVMSLARDEALRLRNDYIGTEHILLGLAAEGSGVGAQALKNLGMELRKVRAEVERLVEQGTSTVSGSRLPFTPRAKRVLEQSLEEARTLGHDYIGTEHLLLGLIRERDGPAAHVLHCLGVDLEAARSQVRALLGAEPSTRPFVIAPSPFLEEAKARFRMVRGLADRALAQVEAAWWFEGPGPGENSIAVVMKHLSGNMRSRWTEFLTTDGEKPDRNRDGEFEIGPADTVEALRARWEEGWALLFRTLDGLSEDDLVRVVAIRGEPHTVLQAVSRQMTHYAYHVGQVVLLARHLAGPGWKSLSIPRGRSKDFEVTREGGVYRPGDSR